MKIESAEIRKHFDQASRAAAITALRSVREVVGLEPLACVFLTEDRLNSLMYILKGHHIDSSDHATIGRLIDEALFEFHEYRRRVRINAIL